MNVGCSSKTGHQTNYLLRYRGKLCALCAKRATCPDTCRRSMQWNTGLCLLSRGQVGKSCFLSSKSRKDFSQNYIQQTTELRELAMYCPTKLLNVASHSLRVNSLRMLNWLRSNTLPRQERAVWKCFPVKMNSDTACWGHRREYRTVERRGKGYHLFPLGPGWEQWCVWHGAVVDFPDSQ